MFDIGNESLELSHDAFASESIDEHEMESNTEYSTPCEEDPQWNNAQFLLRATKQLSLTHAGVTDLCETTSSYVGRITEKVYRNVISTLNSHEVTISDSMQKDIMDSCIISNAFDGLSTRATRESYYRKQFHYVVSQFSYF